MGILTKTTENNGRYIIGYQCDNCFYFKTTDNLQKNHQKMWSLNQLAKRQPGEFIDSLILNQYKLPVNWFIDSEKNVYCAGCKEESEEYCKTKAIVNYLTDTKKAEGLNKKEQIAMFLYGFIKDMVESMDAVKIIDIKTQKAKDYYHYKDLSTEDKKPLEQATDKILQIVQDKDKEMREENK